MPQLSKVCSALLVLLSVIFIGSLATACMDLLVYLLHVFFGLPVNWGLVGRWAGHILQGDFIFRHIQQSAPISHENAIGWVAHYCIGISYAFIYCFITIKVLKKNLSLLSAVIFLLFLMLVPFLVEQPAMGAGYFASLTPHPWVARLITLASHLSLAIGIFMACLLEKALLKHSRLYSRTIGNQFSSWLRGSFSDPSHAIK